MALALTSGGESRLDGAPLSDLPAYQDWVEAERIRLRSNPAYEAVSDEEIDQLARQYVADQMQSFGQQQAAAAAGRKKDDAASRGAKAARRAGGRPVEVEDAEATAYGEYGDSEIADMRNPVGRGMQSRGPTLGSEAWDAQSLRHNVDDLPYEAADEQSIREEYSRRFGRPPRTAEEVQFMREQLGDEAEQRMGGAGTWGAQKPFRSEAERDGYRARTPDQYSQEQMDMMQVQGGGGSPQGWVLVYNPETGGLMPMQRAPAPEGTTPYGFPEGSQTKVGERLVFVEQPGSDDTQTRVVPTRVPVMETNPGVANSMTGGQRVGPAVDNLGVQPGLRNESMERRGYVPRWMEGPQGGEWVYDLEPQRRQELQRGRDDWQERQRRQRLASRAGMNANEAATAIDEQYKAEGRPLSFDDQLRMQGDLARADAKRTRQARVSQQAMLAGGQPTGGARGTRATTNAINQLGPGWREIAILDRLTGGRVGGPTPLGVEAQQMSNALPVVRSAVAGMMQDLDPAAAATRQMEQQARLMGMPADERARLGVIQGEPMGGPLSSQYVNDRWDYWMNQRGASSAVERERGFRRDMERLYGPAQVDTWIESRRGDVASGTAAPPAPADPGGPRPPGANPRFR